MGHVVRAMETQNRRPPVIDMTPEGEFRDPTPPRATGLDRLLARLGGVAMLVAIGATALMLAGLAVLAIGVLLPVAIVAGAIGAGSLWWRARRGGGLPVRFVVLRR